jgi:hypothetical protein
VKEDIIHEDEALVLDCVKGVVSFSPIVIGPLDVFSVTSENGWANSTDLVTIFLDEVKDALPLIWNVPGRRDIRMVAQQCGQFCRFDGCPTQAPPLLGYFKTKDPSLYGSLTSESVTATIYLDILWPIAENNIESDTIDLVLSLYERFSDLSEMAVVSKDVFQTVDLIDPQFYGNRNAVAWTRDDLWSKLLFPVDPNEVTGTQLSEITHLPPVYSVEPFITQVRNPLEYFELDDTHSLTGDTAVAQMMENILLEFDPELPLELNLLPCGIDNKTVSDLPVFDIPVSPVDFRALLLVDPTNRRVDFAPLPRMDDFFNSVASDLPIGLNRCNAVMLSDILLCVESPTDPLLGPLHLPHIEPLLTYEAPDEIEAEVESIVYRLLELILAIDVVPFVPILTDIYGEEWSSVLDGLITDPVFVKDAEDYAYRSYRIGQIIHVSGPVTDIPVLITADDLVGRILREYLLPDLPVRPREIDEIISDELDEFDIDSSEFSSEEEDLPDEIVRMITYRPKKAFHLEDRVGRV